MSSLLKKNHHSKSQGSQESPHQVNAKVDAVVQEYMDSLLGDLFPLDETDGWQPEVASESATPVDVAPQPPDIKAAQTTVEQVAQSSLEQAKKIEPESVTPHLVQKEVKQTQEIELTRSVTTTAPSLKSKPEPINKTESVADLDVPSSIHQNRSEEIPVTEPVVSPVTEVTVPAVEPSMDTSTESVTEVEAEPVVEKRFPQAPIWAQHAFDVLLFDVCGLKLAVPMDTLGRIIKTDAELTHLIGRPNWFMGAYNEAEQPLYVVDTAKYIMPEKGFDLTESGFSYLIQLQRTQWTLACQNVHTTVRLQPDQVKWRSQQGKRKWLAGTVIDHMCALIHVDTLVEILESEVTARH